MCIFFFVFIAVIISRSTIFKYCFELNFVIYLGFMLSACQLKDSDNQIRRVKVVKTDTSYVTRGRIIDIIDSQFIHDTIRIKDYDAFSGTNQINAVIGDNKNKPIAKSASLKLSNYLFEKNRIYSLYPGFNLEAVYGKLVQIQNNKILIPISNNVLMIYENNQNPTNSNEYRKYTYFGYFPCIEFHLLRSVVEDATYYILLNHKDGSEYIFDNMPKISPNCNYFCVENESLDDNEEKGTFLSIYSLSKFDNALVVTNVLDTFFKGYFNLKAYWHNDKLVSIDYTRTSFECDKHYDSHFELSNTKKAVSSKN